MGVRIEADDSTLAVVLTGWDAVWALRRRVEAPLASVAGVAVGSRAEVDAERPLFRAPGTFLPGVIVAGTYHGRHTRPQFWCAHRAEEVLVVDLAGPAPLARLVLEVDDPHRTAAELAGRIAC